MNTVKKFPVRIAMRVEGSMWNTYLAMLDTMEGAKLIASIVHSPFENHPERTEAYKALIQAIVAETIEATFGKVERWDENEAPTHERGGSA